MKQREIWRANLNPTKGNEQQGFRPIIIISGNAMNDNLGVLIVCPLTSKIKNYAGCLVLEADKQNGLKTDSEVLTFHVRSLAKERLVEKLGEITEEQLEQIKQGLVEILRY